MTASPLVDRLADLIAQRALAPGQKLPSERTLASSSACRVRPCARPLACSPAGVYWWPAMAVALSWPKTSMRR
jgi:hypothetical protein